MKTKIVIGSILAIFMLIMMPSISAIEVNVVSDTNKKSLFNRIQGITDKLNRIIFRLKELVDLYIDLELIVTIVLMILSCILMEKQPNILMIISMVGMALVVVYEFISGEEIAKCSKTHSTLILSLTAFIVALESKFISNKLVLQVVGGATFMIGLIIALMLMYSPQ